MQITTDCPSIRIKFDPKLLSTPIYGYDSEYLYRISEFLKNKIKSNEFRQFPDSIERLKQKHQKFLDLYERAKIEEEQAKTKTRRKTQMLGYRPRLANKNDQRIFDGLSDRAQMSKDDRWRR